MGELRLKFEETEFFKRTLIDATQPYVSFKDGEYKGPQNLMSFIIRLNSGWDVFKEQQSKIEGLEKSLDQMKYINDEKTKNLVNAFKTIEVQQKFDADSQGAIEHLTEMNKRYLGKMQEQQDMIASVKDVIKKHNRYIPHSTIKELEKALRGDS